MGSVFDKPGVKEMLAMSSKLLLNWTGVYSRRCSCSVTLREFNSHQTTGLWLRPIMFRPTAVLNSVQFYRSIAGFSSDAAQANRSTALARYLFGRRYQFDKGSAVVLHHSGATVWCWTESIANYDNVFNFVSERRWVATLQSNFTALQ